MALKSTYLSFNSSKPTCYKATDPVAVARPAQDVLAGILYTCIVSMHVHTLLYNPPLDGNQGQWDSCWSYLMLGQALIL